MFDFGENKYVIDALNDYLTFKNPKFAVLITGKWGCGKTWIIRKYIDYVYHNYSKINESSICPLKICYISLFGLTKLEEIDNLIFKSFHPFLSSPSANMCNEIGEFILDKINLTFSIPINKKDINKLGEFIKYISSRQHKDIILVLDDFERCNISKHSLLGYINNQVNEYNAKIIIIANSEEIEEYDKFILIKEKVIGQTINVIPNIQQVFSSCIDDIKDIEIKELFRNNIEELKKIFFYSKSHNLRHLFKLIFEFSRIYKNIKYEYKKHSEFINNILQSCFIMSIETHENKKELDTIFEKNTTCWPTINPFLKNGKSQQAYNFFEKYQIKNLSFSPQFWDNFLVNGIILQEDIDQSCVRYISSLQSSEKFIPLILWDLFRMDEDIVDKLLPKMKKELLDKKYKDLGIFLHSAGILLSCAKYQLIQETAEDIVNFIIECMNGLEFIIDNNIIFDSYMLFSGCYGREYHENNSPEFVQISNIAKDKYKLQYSNITMRGIDNILNKISSSFDEAIALLINLENNFSGFFVAGIECDKFADVLYTLSNKNLRTIYPHIYFLIKNHIDSRWNDMFDIIPWKERLITCLQNKLQVAKHPLCKITMEVFLTELKNLHK